MGGIVLLSLLATGAAVALLIELFGSDGSSDTPDTPGDEDTDGPDTMTPQDDRITGTAGSDTLTGTAENDDMFGLAGQDILLAGAGDDFLSGGDDQDVLFGGAGNDTVQGGIGPDALIGDRGADSLSGGLGGDVLIGVDIGTSGFTSGTGADADFLAGLPDLDTDEGDTLSGGFGDDEIILGSQDSATGGEGDDSFVLGEWVDPARPAVITDFNGEDDTITLGIEGDLTDAEVLVRANAAGESEIVLNGVVVARVIGTGATLTAADLNLIEIASGPGPGPDVDDTLTGTAGSDTLFGFGGDDSLIGLEGEDTLMGGDGDDTAQGGPGADVVLGRDGDDALTGGTGADLLRGGLGNDTVFDNFGVDTLIGSGGDDLLASGAFFDGAALTLATGDTTLAALLSAIPDDLADTDREDVLNGQTGDDTMIGGRDDTLIGGEGNDVFVGGDWTIGTRAPVVSDFAIADDVILYASSTSVASDLTVTYEGEDAVLRDAGQPVMIIQGVGSAFTLAQVQFQAR